MRLGRVPSVPHSPMCHWTNGRARERNKNARPGCRPAGWVSLSGKPLARCLPLTLGSFGQGGLVKPRPLTCWQSGPQRLVKRPCHAHAALRQKRGLLDDSLLARRRTTRIGPCLDVRDEIGHCTHFSHPRDASETGLPAGLQELVQVVQVAPAALGRRIVLLVSGQATFRRVERAPSEGFPADNY
jgi:hypothetical protein